MVLMIQTHQWALTLYHWSRPKRAFLVRPNETSPTHSVIVQSVIGFGPIDIYRDNSKKAQICEYISSFYIFVQLCLISLIISCALVCFLCILHIHNFFSIIPVDLRNISIFKFLISLKFCEFLDLNELKRFDFDLPASFWIGIWILILIMVFISSDCYLFYGFDKFLVRPKFAPLLDLRKRIKRADQCLIWISCKIQFI